MIANNRSWDGISEILGSNITEKLIFQTADIMADQGYREKHMNIRTLTTAGS